MLIISTHPRWYTTSRTAMQKQRSTERNSGGPVAALHGFLGSALQSRGSSTRRKKKKERKGLFQTISAFYRVLVTCKYNNMPELPHKTYSFFYFLWTQQEQLHKLMTTLCTALCQMSLNNQVIYICFVFHSFY